ncbi:MAG: potassium transporter [Alteromonadaceae bacterium]|nr:MAG: potassium transporter [Alteromonadaceae bacterium]
MHFAIISKVLGILLMLFSVTMLPPLVVSFGYEDGAHFSFIIAFVITAFTGTLAWFPVHKIQDDLRTRDGFLITSLFWIVLSLFGSLPFMILGDQSLPIVNAVFESMSGLTTTGATVITDIESLPKSILYYRQQLQWFGGIGIIVIAVAILPMLGIGGMQLYRAETPGPVKDSKLTPRITGTAKALFMIYLGLTVACAVAYRLAGMEWFDAIGHSFSTVAIGGFSTYDDSIGHFSGNEAVMLVCMLFMFISAVNFALHFVAWNSRGLKHYLQDPEFRFYASMVFLGVMITVGYLTYSGTYGISEAALKGSFELISVLTTTGFGVTDFSLWPTFLPFLVFMFAFMGGCAGSTGGGIKMIRVLLIAKQGARELQRLIHPNAILHIKVGSKIVSDRVVEAVWGFFAVYTIAFLCIWILLMATGLDFITAFSAVAACINNLGPGLGEVSTHYGNLNALAKWVLCFAMLLGRLEVFTLLVLFTPAFWRR